MNKQNNSRSVKISIIIPFYNIEDYVAKCLDSVLTQDMPDFEIIAVNDGSTDTTPCLLEEYAKKDSRIKLLHLKNGGLSWARNQGVLKATGEYIMFIDGDDFILPGCLSKLYDYAGLNNADVVIFTYMRWRNGVFEEPRQFSYPKDTAMNSLTATKQLILNGDHIICNKFIKRKLYAEGNIRFEEGMLAEDFPVSCHVLIKAQRIFYLDMAFYSYVQRSGSIMNKPETFKRIHDSIHAYDLVKEKIQEAGWEYELADVFEYIYFSNLMGLLMSCYQGTKQYKSFDELKKTEVFLEERLYKMSCVIIFSNPYGRGKKISHKIKDFRLKTGLYKLEKSIERFYKKALKNT